MESYSVWPLCLAPASAGLQPSATWQLVRLWLVTPWCGWTTLSFVRLPTGITPPLCPALGTEQRWAPSLLGRVSEECCARRWQVTTCRLKSCRCPTRLHHVTFPPCGQGPVGVTCTWRSLRNLPTGRTCEPAVWSGTPPVPAQGRPPRGAPGGEPSPPDQHSGHKGPVAVPSKTSGVQKRHECRVFSPSPVRCCRAAHHPGHWRVLCLQ